MTHIFLSVELGNRKQRERISIRQTVNVLLNVSQILRKRHLNYKQSLNKYPFYFNAPRSKSTGELARPRSRNSSKSSYGGFNNIYQKLSCLIKPNLRMETK